MAGGRIKGITIEINGDTVGLNNALKNVNTSIKATQSSLKDVERLLKLDPKNVELLRQKQEYLSKSVEETRNKLQALKDAEQQVQQQFAEGKISQEQYDALQREIAETEQELRRLEEQAQQTNNSMQTISQVGESFQAVGGKITAAGQALMPLSLAAAGVGAAAIKITADFDEAMSKVSAISGATGDDFDKLRAKAREMGAETKFSATESAQAFTYMAMAGWDTEKMLNGISGVMSLAAADGLDLATTSDIVTDAMTAFGLKAEQSGHFADVLAKGSSSANTNVSMLGESFKYVAPLAGALGYSVEDTTVALGLMANAGIKGSQAGTSLKTALANLTKPTAKMRTVMDEYNISIANSDGSMKSLSQIMDMLRTNLGGLGAAQQAAAATTLFGKEAMAGMLTIINASETDYKNLTEAIANADGTAKKMADTMQQNLNGQLTILKSGLEEAAISIGDALMPLIQGLVAAVQGWVTWFNSLNDTTKSMIAIIGLLVAALAPLLVVIGTLITSIGTIMTAIPAMMTAFAAFSAAGGPVLLAVAAVGLLVAALGSASDSTEKYKEKAKQLTDTEQEMVDSIGLLKEEYDSMEGRRQAAIEGISSESDYTRSLFAELQSITAENGRVQEGYEERAAFILGELSSALGQEYTMTGDQIDNYKEMSESLENLILQKQAKAVLDAEEEKYTAAIKNQTEAFMEYQKAQTAVNELSAQISQAKADETAAQNDLNSALETSKWIHDGVDPKITKARQSLEEARGTTQGYEEKLKELNNTLQSAEDMYTSYNATIQNYEGLSASIISGDTEKIGVSLEMLKNNFQTAETGTRDSLIRQTATLQEQLTNMQAAVNSGAPGITQAQVNNMQELVTKSQDELLKLPQVAQVSNEQILAQLDGMKNRFSTFGKNIGSDYTSGYAIGVKEGQGQVNAAVSVMAEDSLSKTKQALDSHSPSRKTHQIGLDYDLGFAQGITEGTSQVTAAVGNVTSSSLNVLITNLQQAMTRTVEFQNSLRTSWQAWSVGLTAVISSTFTTISTATASGLNNVKTSFSSSTLAIKSDWMSKWQAIQADFSKVMHELDKLTKDTLTALKAAFSTNTAAVKTDTVKAFTEMMAGVESSLKKLKPTIEDNFKPAVDYIKSLVPQSKTWGADMMDGYIAGVRSRIKELEATVKSVATTVSDYMHFTRPEKGPLRNYEEWMPHMMEGLSKGIAANKHLVTEQIEDLANSMSAINSKQTLRANLFNQVVLDGKVLFDSFNELAGEAL
nr:MAG TPA: minor tail protein [Caudoviricetes sp.]